MCIYRQEIVLIGTNLDHSSLRSKLHSCLLTDKEMIDESQWALFEDPFPPSDFEDDDDHDDDDGDDNNNDVEGGFEADIVKKLL